MAVIRILHTVLLAAVFLDVLAAGGMEKTGDVPGVECGPKPQGPSIPTTAAHDIWTRLAETWAWAWA
jgi:hypothetical protein